MDSSASAKEVSPAISCCGKDSSLNRAQDPLGHILEACPSVRFSDIGKALHPKQDPSRQVCTSWNNSVVLPRDRGAALSQRLQRHPTCPWQPTAVHELAGQIASRKYVQCSMRPSLAHVRILAGWYSQCWSRLPVRFWFPFGPSGGVQNPVQNPLMKLTLSFFATPSRFAVFGRFLLVKYNVKRKLAEIRSVLHGFFVL